MSIVSLPRRPVHYVDEEDKSDLFTLIWLDQDCKEDHRDILRTKLILKEINKNSLFYNDINQFYDHLENNYFFETKTLLIISGSYVEIFLDNFRDNKDKLPLLIIFCHDYKKYENHLKSYYVNDICNNHDSLKASIEHLLSSLKFHLYDNRRFNTILSLKTRIYNNTNTLYSYILLIEILKQTSNMKQAKESMINQVKNFYQNDSKQLLHIEFFRDKYQPKNAIEWYTEDTFVYRLVNRAFRTEDSAMWYTFRFYINDLCKQLEEVHCEQKIKKRFIVYRGQSQVPKQEFDNIISNCGGLISCNGFLSTSKSFDKAKQFIFGATDTEHFHVVIFEIIVNANELKHTIFVDITRYFENIEKKGIFQNSGEEEEILFNIGTVFQIDNYEKEEEFWRIRMHVTDECIEDIKQRMETIQKKFSKININLFFGKLLIDMHHYDKAESYFKMISRNLPEPNHYDQPSINEYLGDIKMRVKSFYKAYEYFEKSFELKRKKYSIDDSNMFIIYNYLGNYYKAIGNIKLAKIYYKKTLNCKNNLINTAITKLNLATIFIVDDSGAPTRNLYDNCGQLSSDGPPLVNKKYSKALQTCLDAREIFEQFQPTSYGDILVCQGVLGDIYFNDEQYDIAESFYLVAFEIGKTYLSIGDPRLIHCIYSLADLYHKQEKQSFALKFCEEQLSIYEKYLSNTKHICIGQILLKMGDLSNDIYYYRKAMEIFNHNYRFDYLSTAKCLMKLAELDSNDDQNNISRALEIYRKIYPPEHVILIQTEEQLIKLKNMK
ncbi:hypothetical protein I4U23_016602 [Adineta vaga]|nr:hypothetical protein I4U23_016602 [Adineta vaga]